jgi:hypothetical protein
MRCIPLGLALHCRHLLRQVSLPRVSIADGNSVGASVTNTLYVVTPTFELKAESRLAARSS